MSDVLVAWRHKGIISLSDHNQLMTVRDCLPTEEQDNSSENDMSSAYFMPTSHTAITVYM